MQQTRTTSVWLRKQFGRPSGVAGRLAGLIMAHRSSNRARSAWTVEKLGIEPGHRVLEVGCGPGVAVRHASERAAEGLVLGIDHSSVMVRQASRRNADAIRRGRVEIRQASVEALVDEQGRFDRIFAINSVDFWPDPPARLRELRDRLNDGGRIALTVQPRSAGANEDTVRRVERKLERLLSEAGFRNVRTERLALAPVAAVCALGERPLELASAVPH